MPPGEVRLTPLTGIPAVGEGDDVASLVGDAIDGTGIVPRDFDIVVVTQKVVSKAEGRRVRLDDVEPSSRAIALAAALGKDPRMVEVVLGESNDVVASGHGTNAAARTAARTRHARTGTPARYRRSPCETSAAPGC